MVDRRRSRQRKTRIVLAILAGEMSIAEAARKETVSRAVDRPVEGGVHRGRQDRFGGGPVGALKPGGAARRPPLDVIEGGKNAG